MTNEPVECRILKPDMQYLLFEYEERPECHAFADEKEALDAILDGSAECLLWYVDNRKTTVQPEPLCPGHIYGDPDNKGPRETPVMVIGKLPRPGDLTPRDEDDGDEFFTPACFRSNGSAAGKYFKDVAYSMGADPATWYITYFFKTLHPKDRDKGARLDAPWMKESIPILQYEITQVGPSYILVFGAEAVKALFGNSAKITQLTGTVLDYEYVDRHGTPRVAKCVCCTSPYAVTRSSDAEEEAKYRTAFQMFVNTIKGIETKPEDLDHFSVKTIQEWRMLKERIRLEAGPDNILAIDVEWNGDHPQNYNWWMRTLQFSWKHGTAASVVIHDCEQNPVFTETEMAEIIQDFQEMWLAYVICGHFFDSDVEGLIGAGFIPSVFDMPVIPKDAETYERYIKEGYPCLFDTAMAAHAYCETDDHSLTAQFLLRCPGVPRYDVAMDEWKAAYAKANKISSKEVPGYGYCPDDILIPYGNYDADVTRRIALFYRDNLHKDPYGLNCWQAYTNSMQQWEPFLEMNCTGICVDRDRLNDLMEVYGNKQRSLLKSIRRRMHWPKFNLNSHYQMREILYGDKWNGAKKVGPLRPEGAVSLMTLPLYTTTGDSWDPKFKPDDLVSPTSNARSLSMLATLHRADFEATGDDGEEFRAEILTDLRSAKILTKVMGYVLKEPIGLEDGEVKELGLSAYICDDNRIRTHLYQTLDTGRAASSRPAMQNISKKREADYKKIVGDQYIGPLRGLLQAQPGHMLIWADFKGAELFAVAVMGNDEVMMDHVSRNNLAEDDPNFYDIHSEVAVAAFKLDCPATKDGLYRLGKSHLRIVAKSVIFGLMYGRGANAIAEEVKEQGVFITPDDARKIMDTIKQMYPGAMGYLDAAAEQVYDRGWISGVCKRYRRKPAHQYLPSDKLAALQRVFKNFIPQNFVAEAMRMALSNLFNYRYGQDLEYDILLQVHDEVLVSAPYRQVARMVDEVLPNCMSKNVALYARSLTGKVDKTRGPYSMGIDTTVGHRYGIGEKDWRETCIKYQ